MSSMRQLTTEPLLYGKLNLQKDGFQSLSVTSGMPVSLLDCSLLASHEHLLGYWKARRQFI